MHPGHLRPVAIIVLLALLIGCGESPSQPDEPSGFVLLNPAPIDIEEGSITIAAPRPLLVTTSFPYLRIHLSDWVYKEGDNLVAIMDEVDDLFPSGCVTATVSDESESITLDKTGSSIAQEGDVSLHVFTNRGTVELDRIFTSVTIQSCRPIKQTTVAWLNRTK